MGYAPNLASVDRRRVEMTDRDKKWVLRRSTLGNGGIRLGMNYLMLTEAK